MEDPALNRNLDETKELQARWSQFHDFCIMAVQQGPQKISAQAEMKFLELKSRIAMLHDGFMAGIKHDQKIGQNIIQIVGDCILLKRVAGYSDAERQKFEFDWNEGYLLLTEQVGSLEEEKRQLAAINKRAYDAAKRAERMKANVHNFLHSSGLKWAISAAVIFMLVYGIPAFGIYNYRNFATIPGVKIVYKIFANQVYRPFFVKDFEYNNYEEVQRDPDYDPPINPKVDRVEKTDATGLDLAYFQNYIVPVIGYAPADVETAKKLVPNNDHFEVHRLKADSQDVQIYAILFKSSVDAAAFVEMARKGIAAHPFDEQKAYLNNCYIGRRANFVAVGYSNHTFRMTYPQNKWLFDPKAPSELETKSS